MKKIPTAKIILAVKNFFMNLRNKKWKIKNDLLFWNWW